MLLKLGPPEQLREGLVDALVQGLALKLSKEELVTLRAFLFSLSDMPQDYAFVTSCPACGSKFTLCKECGGTGLIKVPIVYENGEKDGQTQ